MTLDFQHALLAPHYWGMVLITALLVGIAVFLHYKVLERLNFSMPHWTLNRRPRILLMIVVIIAVHIAEIWIFGIGIYCATLIPEFGAVIGVDHLRMLDAIYLFAATFSTVGYGDLAPVGPIRLILGTEALTGFVLITWSASFTYLEMQRYWRPH